MVNSNYILKYIKVNDRKEIGLLLQIYTVMILKGSKNVQCCRVIEKAKALRKQVDSAVIKYGSALMESN